MGADTKAKQRTERPTRLVELNARERGALINFLGGVPTKGRDERRRRRFLRQALRITQDDFRVEARGAGAIIRLGRFVGGEEDRVFRPLKPRGHRLFEVTREQIDYLLGLLREAQIDDASSDVICEIEDRLTAAQDGSRQPPKAITYLTDDDFGDDEPAPQPKPLDDGDGDPDQD